MSNHISKQFVLHFNGSSVATEQLLNYLNSLDTSYELTECPDLLTTRDADGDTPLDFIARVSECIQTITKKELSVLRCIMDGMTNKAISLRLDLTERTIELRKAAFMRKLGARSHTELVHLITKYQTLKNCLIDHTNSVSDNHLVQSTERRCDTADC